MKTLVRIAVSLERIAAALERIAGTAVYQTPGYDAGKCMFCHQRHAAMMPCPSTVRA